ncbi:DUF1177 domain-containing protein [Propionimicrobium sp. PCR01-08-3]|uniref:DUF1177 domain-containing protein n=1 Tax=Propionimicrobium sp. PCR01-08-3 TaxID=3052086 RepID=UPI00255C4D87|nr:DUF1177 domain-containing protein [Propionimicrobium sp. PCR01-08-3]WIY83209.1 DUF1177 domain-containing protein [Propionimicrobium sp. PCR01-08-3]
MLYQVLQLLEILDSPTANGQAVVDYLSGLGAHDAEISTSELVGPRGSTGVVRIFIPGSQGKSSGGTAPTLQVVGRLGGLGARPERIGFVSDGDGALAALSAAAKLLKMHAQDDVLPGDVICSTHVCPDAPTRPHEPVPFMDSPVEMSQMNEAEVDDAADAIVSIDTTKGNRVINHRGIAISPTVQQGYIMKISDDLVRIVETVTGEAAVIFALSTQDITPYENGLYHLNSILQPATATDAPVVGVALVTETAVAGCATGATHETDVADAAKFAVEVAKEFGAGTASFVDAREFDQMVSRYGSAKKLQTVGDE